MLWLTLAILVALGWSFGVFIDNYNTDVNFKGRLPQGQKVFSAVAYTLTAVLIAVFWPILPIEIVPLLLLVLSGVLASVASVPYYNALKSENATGATIFAQLAPVMYLIAGWVFLGQEITLMNIVAFLVILAAPVIVIASTGKRHKRLEFWATGMLMLYLLLCVASNLVFIGAENGLDFVSAFFWFMVGKALTDIILVTIFKKWRVRFMNVLRERKLKLLMPMLINQGIYTFTEVGYRLALTLGSVAIVSVVTNAAQLIITFVLGLVLTWIWPNFGREKLKKRTILAHLVATVVAVVGIVLLQ
ncbi:MAG: EamA family transporter [Candidatus Nomurabacteria bacterium]|jgi:drug/metabolite transporter (DMT)-like permease|nr:EamA family transporter [Candidatus Nomurabacteria bacterium]